jgi:hypothetical protein
MIAPIAIAIDQRVGSSQLLRALVTFIFSGFEGAAASLRIGDDTGIL